MMLFSNILFRFIQYLIVIVLFISCTKHVKQDTGVEVIPLMSCIEKGEYYKENLSSYAQSITYIPLETSDSCLVGEFFNSRSSFYGKGFFYLLLPETRSEHRFYKFTETGKFVTEIGKKGQGPGEYILINAVDVDWENERIYINNNRISLLEYTLEGKFIQSYPLGRGNILGSYSAYNMKKVSSDLFYFALTSAQDDQYMGMFSDLSLKHPVYIPSRTIMPVNGSTIYFDGSMTKNGNENYYYEFYGSSDTIYAINRDLLTLTPRYVMDVDRTEKKYKNVRCLDIINSDNYLFFYFNFGRGIYNKADKTLKILSQPIPKWMGLNNDIDGGLPFWPAMISEDGKSMFMRCPADKFIAHYSKLKNPSEAIKKVLSEIDEDSNPIMIRADFK